MTLEQGLYLGGCPHRLQDGRVVRGRAWAIASEGGWWRPDWSWALQMRWADYQALPGAERPL